MADDTELAKSKFWKFEDDTGKWFTDGKVYWPDHIIIEMSRREALECAEKLLHRVNARLPSEDQEPIRLSFSGRLSVQAND
jgi:hypothetical protein